MGFHRTKRWRSRACALAALCFLAGNPMPGQEVEPALKELELPKFELPKLPLWDRFFNFHAGAGYKDNVLLSKLNHRPSGFASSGLEATLWRLPVDGLEFFLFASADDVRYWRNDPVDKEQTGVGTAQVKKELAHGWQVSLTAQYIYQDQVLDLSASEANFASVRVVTHGYTGRPAVRKALGAKSWLEFELSATRQDFDSPLDDYWEAGPKLTLTREYGHKSNLSLSFELNERFYDHREQFDTVGVAIRGSGLEYQQDKAQLSWRHHWDKARRWRTTTRLAYEFNRDNGPGYFDYAKFSCSEQIRYQTPGWEIRLQGRVSKYNYAVQTASATDFNHRQRTDVNLNVRAERALAKQLHLFAEYDYDRSLSNQSISRYVVNTASSGLSWDF
jgi:hypothetical protein